MVPLYLRQEPVSLTEDCKVYFFMLNSAPKGPQATQPEISQNVADMLRLHEDILLEIKTLIPGFNVQSDVANQQQSNHRRGYSVESVEAMLGENAVKKARSAHANSWFGNHKGRTLLATAGEAAEVAKVFERMVCGSHHPKLQRRRRLTGYVD